MTTLLREIKPIKPAPLPLAVNLQAGCELLGIDYDTARKYRLFTQWEQAGVIWTIPGTEIKRIVVARLQEWVERTLAEQEAR